MEALIKRSNAKGSKAVKTKKEPRRKASKIGSWLRSTKGDAELDAMLHRIRNIGRYGTAKG